MEKWEQVFYKIYQNAVIQPLEKVMFKRGWQEALKTVKDIHGMDLAEIYAYADGLAEQYRQDAEDEIQQQEQLRHGG